MLTMPGHNLIKIIVDPTIVKYVTELINEIVAIVAFLCFLVVKNIMIFSTKRVTHNTTYINNATTEKYLWGTFDNTINAKLHIPMRGKQPYAIEDGSDI